MSGVSKIAIAESVEELKLLMIPSNIILLFQPPYCPELNPIERLWEYIKYYL
ncbi:MAG: transposase [Prochloraceae cyanobacterium]|nr:transposase [Prochloraceae cyanobacterium]